MPQLDFSIVGFYGTNGALGCLSPDETEIKRLVLPDRNEKHDLGSEDSGLEKQASEESMINPGEVQERLGFGLRSMYRSVLEEPLPADMMALLDQLDESEGSGRSDRDSGTSSSE